MKFWKWCMTLLIVWNSTGVLLILFRYKDLLVTGASNEYPRREPPNNAVKLTTFPDDDSLARAHDYLDRFRLRGDRSDEDWPNADVVFGETDRRFRAELVNVPPVYFNSSIRTARHPYYYVGSYLLFPSLQDIRFNNVYWQTLSIGGATFYLFGAYYDDRLGNVIRVLAMVDLIPPPLVRCALWFDGGLKLGWSSAVHYEMLWRTKWGNVKNGTLQPYLISCSFRKSEIFDNAVPEMITLVNTTQKNGATNNLLVLNKMADGDSSDGGEQATTERGGWSGRSKRREFGVCVKGLDYDEDTSMRLLEWVHLLRLLGAEKIFFYLLRVHPNVATLLDQLESEGLVEVVPLTLPGFQPNLPQLRSLYLRRMVGNKRMNEIVPYNDCLYRNLYRFKYLILLDVDEVMMPLTSSNWSQLMVQIQSLVQVNQRRDFRPASYNVRNVYFFDNMMYESPEMSEIPSFLHMSRRVIRSARYTARGHYVKCFHDVGRVRALHNHYPLSCLGTSGYCSTFDVSPFMAHVQHYREDCHDIKPSECEALFRNDTVTDFGIWRYRKPLIEAVQRHISRYQPDANNLL